MVSSYQIQLTEDGCTMEGNREILYVRDRVPICSSDIVECTVISAGSPIAWGLFGDHMKGGRPAARGWSDNSQLEHMLKLVFGSAKSFWGKTTCTGRDWGTCSDNVVCYSML